MYHPRLKGTHYEMGLHYGALLHSKGVSFEDFIQLNDEQIEFGKQSLVILKKFCPEMVDELFGMAEGQKISPERFAYNLLTAGVFEKDIGCSCACFRHGEDLIFARNHDMFSYLKKTTESALYRPDDKYIFLGQSDAIVGKEDGINEKGLAVGINFVAPKTIKPGINFLFIVRHMLENFTLVAECIDWLKEVPLSSTQNFIMLDKTGDMKVIEACAEKQVVRNPEKQKYIISTNHFVTPEMQPYDNAPMKNWYQSEIRYTTLETTLLNENDEQESIRFGKDLLSGKYGFVCNYDRKIKFDTLWSFIVRINDLQIHRAEGNPMKAKYKEDKRLAWGISKDRK